MTWKKVKLREVISHRKGFIEIDDETEYKLVTVKLHRKGVFLRENLQGFQIRTKKQQVCKAGDFIVAEMDAKVGGYGFIPVHLDGAIVSSHYFLFDVNEDRIRPQYLEVVSQLKILQDQIKAVGSTNYAAIRPYNVLDWEIPFPPIEKQIEIENLYLVAKEKVDLLNLEFADQLSQLENLNQAILQEAVQGKLVKQDPKDEPASELLKRIKAEKAKSGKKEKPLPPIKPEEIPFEIPENWVWCRLGEVVLSMANGIYKQDKFYNDSGIGCLRMYNIKEGKINFNNLKRMILTDAEIRTYELQKNDVLLNRVNSVELLGKAAIIDELIEPLVFESKNIRLRFIEKSILPIFVNYYMLTPFFKEPILKSFKKVTGQASISQEKLNPILIPLPPLSEQKRIVAEIEKQLSKTKQLKEHIIQSQQATEQLLKALLHQAFLPAEAAAQAGEVREMEEVNS